MNVEIRQTLHILVIYTILGVTAKQHTSETLKNVLEKQLEPQRFTQIQGYGSVTEVEPSPNIRVYVYNTEDSFNPNNEMFSKRTLRVLENEKFGDQSVKIKNEFSKMRDSQKRQLANIMDGIERSSRGN